MPTRPVISTTTSRRLPATTTYSSTASGYRRAVKYGQRDAANEILRTETLSRLGSFGRDGRGPKGSLFVVSEPSAIAELVVSKKRLDSRTLTLKVGQTADIIDIEKTLRDFGFTQTDYVYEPGQFAVRGSILDVYSFSSELPFRVDFFGNDIDTIRTFEVESQLSHDKLDAISVVPELATLTEEKVPFLQFLPEGSILVMKNYLYVHDTIQRVYDDGFSSQAITEQLEATPRWSRPRYAPSSGASRSSSPATSLPTMPRGSRA